MSQENQNIQEEPHKRRVRYKGKYPRNYKEKYKELNPEKYQDTIEKVIRKGSTPGYDEEDIYEYLENSFEELVWDWGYLALVVG